MKINFLNKALIFMISISSFTGIVFLNNNNNNNNNNKIENENSNVTVKQIESGVGFSGLVLTYDNSDHLYMWGDNTYGQLGIGNTTQQITPQEVDINQDGILGNEGKINSFLIGGYANLLWSTDSSGDHLYSWGRNKEGNLGIGQSPTLMPFSPIPVEIPLSFFVIDGKQTDIQKIAISQGSDSEINNYYSTFANDIVITMDDDYNEHLFIWGDNAYGQLGDSEKVSSSLWIDEPFEFETELLKDKKRIQEIEIGHATIGMVIDNSLYTWGSNLHSEMGIDEVEGYDKHLTPSLVNFDPDIGGGETSFEGEVIIKQIDFSWHNSSAVLSDDERDYLYTWGENDKEQLGEDDGGDPDHFHKPQMIENISNDPNVRIKKIFNDPKNIVVIIEDEVKDKLLISGDNAFGQFGRGDNFADLTNQFIECNSIIEDKIINLSLNHGSLIINTIDDSNVSHLYSWGNNNHGQLGLGVIGEQHYTPQEMKYFIPSPSPKFSTISNPVENSNSEFQMKVDYSLSSYSLYNNFFKENYINKIEVVDGRGGDGKVYGSINSSEDTVIPLSGSIGLDGLIPGNNYSSGDLYLKVTYNDNLIFGDSTSSAIPEFTVPKNDALVPTIESVSQPIFDQDKVGTIDYAINISEETSTTEETNVSKIEVVDSSGATYGSASTIEPTGTIILENLIPGTTYSTGELYLEVTYIDSDGQEVEIGGSSETNSAIPGFTVPKNDALVPTIESVSQPIFDQDKVGTIDYAINISEETSTTEGTNVSKIEVVDSSGATYGSASIIEPTISSTGKITLENLLPGKTYSAGELYLEVTYIGSDGQEVEIGGSSETNSAIPEFTVPKNDAALPTFVSATTVNENPFSVHYSLNVPIVDSTTEDTIINKIEVTNGNSSVLGSVDSSQGEIPNSGEIILNNINNNSTYENYYLVVYSNAGVLNADGTNPLGNVPTINTLDPANPPTIVSTDVFDITAKSAIVKYEISIPTDVEGVERTILTKIAIIDSSGNIYGEISDKNGLNPMGEIELTLKPSQTYEGLYLEVIYNGNEENPIGGSEIESSLIPSFKTKINPMIIYGSGALLILIIILIIIIIIVSLLRKKAKTEKNYHINKSKR